MDGRLPNSGATYRSLEVALLLGVDPDREWIRKGFEYLQKQVRVFGGLPSPGPVEEAPVEVGTTARFLHILLSHEKLKHDWKGTIQELAGILLERCYETPSTICWHTDRADLKNADQGVVGATSLALYALLRIREIPELKDLWPIEKAEKVVYWLLKAQKTDGSWGDKTGLSKSPGNPDNTFNVIRALKTFLALFPQSPMGPEVREALKRGLAFLKNCVSTGTQRPVSEQAMILRGILLFCDDPDDPVDPWHETVLKALDLLVKRKNEWFSPKAHYYNEFLITLLAIGEWLEKAGEISPERADFLRQQARRPFVNFLYEFPAEIYPFLPGYKDTLGERILNSFVRLKVQKIHTFTSLFFEIFNLQDVASLFLATFFFYTLFISEDFLRSLICVHLGWFTWIIVFLYMSWIALKVRTRHSWGNFILTTLFSFIIAGALLKIINLTFVARNTLWIDPRAWGCGSSGSSEEVWRACLLPTLRVFLVLASMIDIGRKLIDLSSLDRLLLGRK